MHENISYLFANIICYSHVHFWDLNNFNLNQVSTISNHIQWKTFHCWTKLWSLLLFCLENIYVKQNNIRIEIVTKIVIVFKRWQIYCITFDFHQWKTTSVAVFHAAFNSQWTAKLICSIAYQSDLLITMQTNWRFVFTSCAVQYAYFKSREEVNWRRQPIVLFQFLRKEWIFLLL